MIDYKGKPFYLKEEDIEWVEKSYEEMSLDEKIGQLFCPIEFSNDEKELKELIETKHIGGVLYREGKALEILGAHNCLQKYSKIPLLVASNLEMGGVGSALEGTYYGRQMLVAATGDTKHAYELGKVSCAEGKAVGVNWSFAPIVDIDRNFHNPITNVRTFGNNPKTVCAMADAYLEAADELNVAVCIKHFPGDGIDERDHHLLTSVNSLSTEEWDESFGYVYKTLIDKGAKTLMVGHIALPSYEAYFNKKDGKEEDEIRVIPASLSENILKKLIREKLAFKGLITTDATPMVGFGCAMERSKALPLAIEYGCDMILFTKDTDEDYRFMHEGIESGLLSKERLEEAVKRILATKASIGLHKAKMDGSIIKPESGLNILRNEEFVKAARECADEGITLVKDTQQLLPISNSKYKRILLEIMGDFPSNERVSEKFKSLLEKEGFEVTVYEKEELTENGIAFDNVSEFRAKYDLVIYIGNIETASNKTVARLNWHTIFGLGNNMPWFVKEVPTMFISVGNPYHLFDAAMIKTYINCYCNSDYVIEAVVEKITGKSEFKGVSPVDAFCGVWDTRQ